jgi:hypothetical protein
MLLTAKGTGYAPVNGLDLYYEIHGTPSAHPPLLILHGIMGTLEMSGPLPPLLAETRHVIAPEMQAHGRTADIERPLSYEQMADDIRGFPAHRADRSLRLQHGCRHRHAGDHAAPPPGAQAGSQLRIRFPELPVHRGHGRARTAVLRGNVPGYTD